MKPPTVCIVMALPSSNYDF